ncbi:hypothetical protein CTAYLR_009297 [Chrysophaeum taylorii]|uniref:DOT1 domain-containing protein n=1 Tax=Chrysophaeum taylorii TaxID=2483200 RepID=A0AAD7UL78_9STRA|nr:hypothetical protein CTAYLR_009297 [Chrysophaeum taylorii]
MSTTPRSRQQRRTPLAPRKKRGATQLEQAGEGKRLFEGPEEDTPEPCVVSEPIKRAYAIVRRSSNGLGETGGAIYGEVTASSFQRVVDAMGLEPTSIFLDVGSGLGKPNFHAALHAGCASFGVELEEVRWQLATFNLMQMHAAGFGGGVYFLHGDITAAYSLDPFSHVYMFDVGFPPTLLETLADLFNRSQARVLASFQKNLDENYGFDVVLRRKIQTSMHGSTEKHACFVYDRHLRASPVSPDPLFVEGLEKLREPKELQCKDAADRLDASHSKPRRPRSARKTDPYLTPPRRII